MDEKKFRIAAKEIQLQSSQHLDTLVFHGLSMAPFLKDGDEIRVAHIAWSRVRIGDIITYRNEDKFPTYRVIKKENDQAIVKPDSWSRVITVQKNDILGKVIERKRGQEIIRCVDAAWIAYGVFIILRNRVNTYLFLLKRNLQRRSTFLKKLLKRVLRKP